MRHRRIVFASKRGMTRHLSWFRKAIVTVCTFPVAIPYGYFGRRTMKAPSSYVSCRSSRSPIVDQQMQVIGSPSISFRRTPRLWHV
jgi:hypothetical protein